MREPLGADNSKSQTLPSGAYTPSTESAREFIAGAGAFCLANATWWMQPIVLHNLIDRLEMSETSAGLILTVELAALSLGSALCARFSGGFSLRNIAVLGIMVAVVASYCSLVANSYIGLLAARAIVGVGTGAGLTMANTIAARFSDPQRVFSQFNVVAIIFGTILLSSFPYIVNTIEGATPYTALLICLLVLLIPISILPGALSIEPYQTLENKSDGAVKHGYGVLLICLVTLLVGISNSTMWAFNAVIAAQIGLSDEQASGTLSAAIFTAFVGVVLASIIGGRFGRFIPSSIALGLMAVAIFVLSNNPQPSNFTMATCVLVATIFFTLPYLFGLAAAQDKSGRGASYTLGVFFFSGAISPTVGGLAVENTGLSMLGILMVVVMVLSIMMIFMVDRKIGNA